MGGKQFQISGMNLEGQNCHQKKDNFWSHPIFGDRPFHPRYHSIERLDRVKRLLSMSSRPIGRIAEETGFKLIDRLLP